MVTMSCWQYLRLKIPGMPGKTWYAGLYEEPLITLGITLDCCSRKYKIVAPSNGLAVANIPGIKDRGSSDTEGVVR